MVVLRTWSGILFVTSPIAELDGEVSTAGAAFSVVSRGTRLSLSHRVEPTPATCRTGAAARSRLVALRRSPLRAVVVAQAKNVDKSCDRHPLHGRKTLFDGKKTRFSCAYRAKSASLQKMANFTARIRVRGSSPPCVFTSLIPSDVAHLRRWRRLVHSPQQRMPSLWK